ncbi:MAG: Holliday junction branch migration protein RuvA [Treponema sp.]|nr:Holliday junction branch migration protein RuvA [Treponema sp.]MCL2236724.1 Holliday junction branch migration protein RuvA [Treponema sp.]
MFNSISGLITAKGAESVYCACNNIEWEINMPVNDIHSLSLNSECRILTWLYHREDQMKMFGFSSERRRNTFLELLKVEGIGPKGAIKIMSGISQDDLETALENGDLARLEAVPGLGKKTAQKMLLSLKGKLVQSQGKIAISSPYNDLIEALVGMGYDRKQSAEAIAKAEEGIDPKLPSTEKEKLLFQEAIVYMSGS